MAGYVEVSASGGGPNSAEATEVVLNRDAKSLISAVYPVRVDQQMWERVETWLRTEVDRASTKLKGRTEDRRRRFRQTLRGERARPPFRPDASNLSVPLTIWAVAAVKARLRTAVLESDPLLVARATPSVSAPNVSDQAGATPVPPATGASSAADISKSLVDFFDAEFHNPRGLGGEQAVTKCINECVPIGTSGLKVFVEPDDVRMLPVIGPDGVATTTRQTVRRGRVRWEYIAADDLIYADGYGSDTQMMPFIGHRYTERWGHVKMLEALGYLNSKAVTDAASYFITSPDGPSSSPQFLLHPLAEIYFDFDINGQGIQTPLCAYYHVGCKKMLGLNYSYAPNGTRPIWIFQFDENADPTLPEGQGICEKLEGAQDESDLIHNLTIEGMKRAIAHLIVLKENSGMERELGGGDAILPGDHAVTGDPEADMVTKPLGGVEGVQIGQMIEASTRQYVTRFLGLDESAVGNLESGKRVPASLGLEIKKDSRVIVAHATNSFGRVNTEATYFTFELWKQRLPWDTMVAAVGPEAATALRNLVFSPTQQPVRNQFEITFNAIDASATQESRKQSLLAVGQYLMSFYDKLLGYGQMAAQLGQVPPLQEAVLDVMTKLHNAVQALLSTVDEIHDISEVLPDVAAFAKAMQQASSAAIGGPPPPAQGGGTGRGAGIV